MISVIVQIKRADHRYIVEREPQRVSQQPNQVTKQPADKRLSKHGSVASFCWRWAHLVVSTQNPNDQC